MSEMDLYSTSNSRLRALLVSLACLLGAGYGGYRLYLDFNSTGEAGAGPPMAKVERREARVRRKAADSFIWSNVKKDENLYLKDSVQTGPSSAAMIKMNDGSYLEVGENSLIVIDQLQNLSLSFLRGSMILRSASGKDQQISVGSDGKAKVREISVRLLQPEIRSKFYVKAASPKLIRFAWQPKADVKENEGLEVQISRSREFAPTVTKILGASSPRANSLSANLPSGLYYWRIVQKNNVLTEARQFQVIAVSPLIPTWPSANTKVKAWGEDGSTQFRWALGDARPPDDEPDGTQVQHVIEVGADPDFKRITQTQTIAPGAEDARLSKLPAGWLYWRIRSRYPDLTVVSPPTPFVLERAKRLAIELGRPDKDASIGLSSELRFNWDCDLEEVGFVFELESGPTSVARQNVQSKSYIWKGPASGSYRWRVSAFKDGQNIGESVWRSFSVFQGGPIVVQEPEDGRKLYYWDEPEKFSFKWKHDPLTEQSEYDYRLELSSNPSFQGKLITRKLKEEAISSKDLALQPGSYSWRVRVVDESSARTIKTSSVSHFEYGPYPTLPPPQALAPGDGASYDVSEHEVSPVLKWEKVDQAKSYILTIYSARKGRRSPAAQRPVFHREIDDDSFEIKGLPPGIYSWTVQSVDRIKRKGKPAPFRKFTLSAGEPLAAPEVTAPEVQ